MTNTRIPPQVPDMEKSVLAAILIDSSSLPLVRDLLSESSFYLPAHATIFSALCKLESQNKPIDLVTVSEELRSTGKLEEVGGELYLSELTGYIPSSAYIEHYAKQVHEKAMLRQVIALSGSITADCYEPDATSEGIIEKMQSQLIKLINYKRFPGAKAARGMVPDTIEKISHIKTKQGLITGISTGFPRLDELTMGFQNGEFVVIAARPSVGKTALALSIAQSAAEQGHGTAIFSLEMGSNQLIMRILSKDARIDNQRLRSTARFREGEEEDLAHAAAQLSETPLFIDDSPGISIFSIRARTQQLWMQHNIGLVIVDYLQLIRPPKPVDSQQQWVTYLSASMKALARELNIPVVVLSQLSRASEQRGEHRPILSDLRDSGTIEQDADVVIFLYRPELYPGKATKVKFQGREYDKKGFTEVIVAKNRNGPTGSFPLTFVRRYASFEPLTEDGPPASDDGLVDENEQPF